MSQDKDKPYVLRVAELIYKKVDKIKKENSEMTNIQAFEVFMTTKDYDLISSGEFHNQWFLELKNNNFIDNITGKKVNEETMRLLELQKDSMKDGFELKIIKADKNDLDQHESRLLDIEERKSIKTLWRELD